jgi:MFS family permease
VSGYMAAYALGQLIFGPIADAYRVARQACKTR